MFMISGLVQVLSDLVTSLIPVPELAELIGGFFGSFISILLSFGL
jgi:hypothetical protein